MQPPQGLPAFPGRQIDPAHIFLLAQLFYCQLPMAGSWLHEEEVQLCFRAAWLLWGTFSCISLKALPAKGVCC